MENGQYVDGSLWYYAPNKGAPVAWAVLFAISGFIHTWQCFHYKSFRVTGFFPWAALLFVIGYACRQYGAFHYDDLKVFICSIVFIYCAPPVYELANYFILSRCLYYIPYHSPIHPGRVLTTFAALSAVVEALNANGAAKIANSNAPPSQQEIGKKLLKAALILQLVVLSLFVLLAMSFHRRCRKAGLLPQNLKAVLVTLYVSSALIGSRTVYRTVEYFIVSSLDIAGVTDPNTLSPLLRYEWYFWIFEGTLMMLNSFLLNARHPMRFLPRDNKIYLAEDGVTEIHGPGYQDHRNFLVTIFDPFDVVGMMKGRNMKQKFWETHGEGRVEVDQISSERGRNGVEVEKTRRGGDLV